MTKRIKSDIIVKLSQKRVKPRAEKELKKIQKTFEKPIDKQVKMWYNIKVVAEKRSARSLERVKNFFKEISKKVLTKRRGCDIIDRLSSEGMEN